MLDWLVTDKNVVFILAAYAAAIGGLTGLTFWTWRAYRKAKVLAERGAPAS